MSLQLYEDSVPIPPSTSPFDRRAFNNVALSYFSPPNASNPFSSSSSSLSSLNFYDSAPQKDRRSLLLPKDDQDAVVVVEPSTRTRVPSGAGAIGDGRKTASTSVSSASSPDKAFSTSPLDIIGPPGPGSGGSNNVSRPQSFILDPASPVAFKSSSALPSLSLSTDDGATAKAFSPTSYGLSGPNGEPLFQTLRRDSSPALAPQPDDASEQRIRALEQKVNDLGSLLIREVRSIKDELAYLRASVAPNRPQSSHDDHAAALFNNLRPTSPRLSRSPGVVYSSSQAQTPLGSYEDSYQSSSAAKDETIAALTAQINTLSASVSALLGSSVPMQQSQQVSRSPLLSSSQSLPPANHLTGLGMRNMRGVGGMPGGVRHPNSSFDDPRRRSALSYSTSSALRPDANSFDTPLTSAWPESNNSTPASPMPNMTPLLGSSVSGNTNAGSPAPHGGSSLSSKWEGLGVGTELFRSIAKYGLGPPTKVQMKAIPCVLRSQDCVVQVPAIQERIQSYTVPALQLIANANQSAVEPVKGIQAIIVCATVDQAAQAQRLFVGLGGSLGIRTSLCTPASDLAADPSPLVKNPPSVLVGTPQKLFELLSGSPQHQQNQPVVSLKELRLLVIDECDQLLARNLAEIVANIVRILLSNESHHHQSRSFDRQTAIFSCTVPSDVLNFASTLQLREPVRVLVRREGNDATAPSIRTLKQYYLYVAMAGSNQQQQQQQNMSRKEQSAGREWKLDALVDLLEDYPFDQAIIFCSSIETVDAVSYKLGTTSIEALALHGDMGQTARQHIVARFRSSSSSSRASPGSPTTKRCLCVHDALARNLSDVHAVQLVINFDLPRAVDDYVHRASCITPALNGKPGTIINVVAPGSDVDMIRALESHYRCKINELPTNQQQQQQQQSSSSASQSAAHSQYSSPSQHFHLSSQQQHYQQHQQQNHHSSQQHQQ